MVSKIAFDYTIDIISSDRVGQVNVVHNRLFAWIWVSISIREQCFVILNHGRMDEDNIGAGTLAQNV